LDSPKAKSGRSVSLRPAAPDDELLLYQWQIHPDTREFARNPHPPTLREHREWFRKRFGSNDSVILIIQHGDEPGGCLRLDRIADGKAPVWEISINIAPECHRLGLAKAALGLVRSHIPGAELVAHVMPHNRASHALFRSAGFQRGADGNYHLAI
jgi:RimJ/RimL family protein N-acetyltransferase